MERAAGRCDYADARRVVRASEHVAIRNGEVESIADEETDGVGVRVRLGGAWGFASSSDPGAAGAEDALRRALAVAEAQPAVPAAPLAPAPPARGHWQGPCEQDPFAVPIERKVELLLAADAGLGGDRRIARTVARCLSQRTTKGFAST